MPFFGIGGDKWQEIRERLSTLGRRAKAVLPEGITMTTGLIMSVNPLEQALYKSYLDHLSTYKGLEEWSKFPVDVVDACALRLLCIATVRSQLLHDQWGVAISSNAISDMVPLAVPLLDQLNTELLRKEYWHLIRTHRVGGLLSTFAQAQNYYSTLRSEQTVTTASVPGGLIAAQARGLYSQGAAALIVGDQQEARFAWALCDIYCKSTDDPTVAMSREALARLKEVH